MFNLECSGSRLVRARTLFSYASRVNASGYSELFLEGTDSRHPTTNVEEYIKQRKMGIKKDGIILINTRT